MNKLFTIITVASIFTACNSNNPENKTALSAAQTTLIKQTDSVYKNQKDSVNKVYEMLLQTKELTANQKDSIKQEKKKAQLALKINQTALLSQALTPEQLVQLQKEQDKKQEPTAEKIKKKAAKLTEEYNLTEVQQATLLPEITKAETAKEAIKKKYSGEGKEKTPAEKETEKTEKKTVDAVFNAALQKILTAEQLKIWEQKQQEKFQKEAKEKN